jgi:hypothetical protein
MGTIIELGQDRFIADLAERVARTCRNRLLDPTAVAVPFHYIGDQLGLDDRQIAKAVAWLERSGRAEVQDFRLKSRPHVRIPAVCRMDDIDHCPPPAD